MTRVAVVAQDGLVAAGLAAVLRRAPDLAVLPDDSGTEVLVLVVWPPRCGSGPLPALAVVSARGALGGDPASPHAASGRVPGRGALAQRRGSARSAARRARGGEAGPAGRAAWIAEMVAPRDAASTLESCTC